jgi:hypothetical protein
MNTRYWTSRKDGYILDSELESVLEWEPDSDLESLPEMELNLDLREMICPRLDLIVRTPKGRFPRLCCSFFEEC